jgi:hypothetical protein
VLFLTVSAFAGAQDLNEFPYEGEPILLFASGGAEWKPSPARFLSDALSSPIASPSMPAINVTIARIPNDSRSEAGKPALRVVGNLTTSCDTIEIASPFPIPQKTKRTASIAQNAQPKLGYVAQAGIAQSVSLHAIQAGDPIMITLSFENEKGGNYSVPFEIREAPSIMITYTFSDPQYTNIPKDERSRIDLGWMRLKSITLQSVKHLDQKIKYWNALGSATDDEKEALINKQKNAPELQAKVDLYIYGAWISHAFLAHANE